MQNQDNYIFYSDDQEVDTFFWLEREAVRPRIRPFSEGVVGICISSLFGQ